MKNRYYISTGAKENFYTLRYKFEEAMEEHGRKFDIVSKLK